MNEDEKWMQLAIQEAIKAEKEGEVPVGQGGDGDYAISKPVSEREVSSNEDVEDLSPVVEEVEDFTPVVEEVEDFSSSVEEVEEFSQVTDSIPDRKVSVSIEQLRKKMSEESDD